MLNKETLLYVGIGIVLGMFVVPRLLPLISVVTGKGGE